MKINIEKLKINIEKYTGLLDEYENTYMNFYYEAEANDQYWKNTTANYFFSLVEEEKKENKKFYEELYSLKLIFEYLVDNYQKYGKKISLNIESKDIIINKINNFKINDIKNLLNDSDLNIVNVESSKIMLADIEKDITQYKETFSKACSDIEKLEDLIKLKLSKIIISPIEEKSSVSHQLGTNDKVFIDIEKLEHSVKKLEMHHNEESIILESLKETFNDISYNYITNNKEMLEKIELDILSKFKIILNSHSNNIKLLNDNIDKTKVARLNTKAILEQIDGEVYE